MRNYIFLGFILSFIQISFATEVDNFTGRYLPLENSLNSLNSTINNKLIAAMDESNTRFRKCHRSALIKNIKRKFNLILVSKIELHIRLNLKSDYNLRFSEGETIYDNFSLFSFNPVMMELSPVLKLNETLIGTDKISHFFNEGYNYYKKLNQTGSLSMALEHGDGMENGFWGTKTTGIFSYADLVSNYQGLIFWKSLLEGNDPYFKCVDNQFTMRRDFDFSDYVDDGWDEAINCSSFRSETLATAFQEKVDLYNPDSENQPYTCPVKPKSCEELREKYGKLSSRLLHPKCR